MEVKKRVLITGAGGGGSNNLIRSLKSSSLEADGYEFVGSNLSEATLGKSELTENYLLPAATEPEYLSCLKRLIEDQSIQLVIPNNDREVRKISEIRSELDCHVFLPSDEAIKVCQDKHEMFLRLTEIGIPMAKSVELSSLSDIEPAMRGIGEGPYWIRMRRGSGSKGATWVNNADQAKQWISLWIELRGFAVDNFTVSEFLPGRDYCFQGVWRDGELVVGKLCERLSYFFGENRLSGMSSTPAVAKTLRDEKAFETVMKAVDTISERPHGNFNFDFKGRKDGTMCLTECNVGRFCMITPIFDLTGDYNTAEAYVRCAFKEEYPTKEKFDVAEGYYLLRDLDTLPTVIHESEIRKKFTAYNSPDKRRTA